ncbi:MAG: hypothetical protein RR910_08410 [Acidaminococcaceae bacterium]
MKYVCVTKCYYNGRVYAVDEVEEFYEGANVPEHFETLETVVEAPKPVAETLETVVEAKGRTRRTSK